MAYKTLIVHIELSDSSERRLHIAAQLAKSLGAELIGVGGSASPFLVAPEAAGMGESAMEDLGRNQVEQARAAQENFEALMRKMGLPHHWASSELYPAVLVETLDAGADLIIAESRGEAREVGLNTADIVVRAGLPVLSLPPDCTAFNAHRILVAWNNTREARRSIAAALPFLKNASSVTVIHAAATATASMEDGLSAIIGRLAADGVYAVAERLTTHSRETASAILDFEDKHPADLLVAGAFGRFQLQEWILGGVTRSLLAGARCPILFTH